MGILDMLFGPPNVENLKEKQDMDRLIKALQYKKDANVRMAAAKALDHITSDWRYPNPLVAPSSIAYLVKYHEIEKAKMLKTALKTARKDVDRGVRKAATLILWRWLDAVLPECSGCGRYLQPTGNVLDELNRGGSTIIHMGGAFAAESWDNYLGTVCTNCKKIFCDICRRPEPGSCYKCGEAMKPAAGMYLKIALLRDSEEQRELNLYQWEDSGKPRRWVKIHRGNWNHNDWLGLLEQLKKSTYWPMDPEDVGGLLEELKKEWHEKGGWA